MQKNIRRLPVLICVFAIAVIAIGCNDSTTEIGETPAFLLSAGDVAHIVTMEDLLTIGAVDVSSSPRDVLRNFTGVPLASILYHFGVDYSSANAVVFQALDGFMSEVSIAEALDYANTFIVFEEDGQPLGTYEEDGQGPFMAVIALDQFPNRWARHLTAVTLQ